MDIVESRFVGMKSRGVYETPGGTVLLAAHRAIESVSLDRGELHLKVGWWMSGWVGVNVDGIKGQGGQHSPVPCTRSCE